MKLIVAFSNFVNAPKNDPEDQNLARYNTSKVGSHRQGKDPRTFLNTSSHYHAASVTVNQPGAVLLNAINSRHPVWNLAVTGYTSYKNMCQIMCMLLLSRHQLQTTCAGPGIRYRLR
jgi:hypothetical protein